MERRRGAPLGGRRKQTTILEFNKPQRNGEHPTMKPVDLIQYQVENSSKAGDTVLDLFGGSGSTLIACEKPAASTAAWNSTRNTST